MLKERQTAIHGSDALEVVVFLVALERGDGEPAYRDLSHAAARSYAYTPDQPVCRPEQQRREQQACDGPHRDPNDLFCSRQCQVLVRPFRFSSISRGMCGVLCVRRSILRRWNSYLYRPWDKSISATTCPSCGRCQMPHAG